jgi:hypothetical protein
VTFDAFRTAFATTEIQGEAFAKRKWSRASSRTVAELSSRDQSKPPPIRTRERPPLISVGAKATIRALKVNVGHGADDHADAHSPRSRTVCWSYAHLHHPSRDLTRTRADGHAL